LAGSITSDTDLRNVLKRSKTIAMVGVSNNPVRASYFVMRYLHYRRYNIVPVNPVYEGQEFFGKLVYASLADIPKDIKIDMLDVFRRDEFVPEIVDDAIENLLPNLKTIWLQLGITHPEAMAKAREHGIETVENVCPKMEYQRLFGELRKAGINTGIISSKLPEHF